MTAVPKLLSFFEGNFQGGSGILYNTGETPEMNINHFSITDFSVQTTILNMQLVLQAQLLSVRFKCTPFPVTIGLVPELLNERYKWLLKCVVSRKLPRCQWRYRRFINNTFMLNELHFFQYSTGWWLLQQSK